MGNRNLFDLNMCRYMQRYWQVVVAIARHLQGPIRSTASHCLYTHAPGTRRTFRAHIVLPLELPLLFPFLCAMVSMKLVFALAALLLVGTTAAQDIGQQAFDTAQEAALAAGLTAEQAAQAGRDAEVRYRQ